MTARPRVRDSAMNKISVAVLLLLFGALLSGRAAAQEVLNYMTWHELDIGGGVGARKQVFVAALAIVTAEGA